jgi:hypothetical protein
VAAVVEEYRVKQRTVRSKDSKAELSSGELMASTKGRLQPVAKLGSELRQAVISVFQALWPRQAVPDDIGTLLQWIIQHQTYRKIKRKNTYFKAGCS